MDVLLAPIVTNRVVSPVDLADERTVATPGASPVESAAGDALLRAWTAAAPHDAVDLCPLSDGGPGFAALVGHRAETVGRGRGPQHEGSVDRLAPGVVLVGTTAYVDTSAALGRGRGSSGVGEQLRAALGADASRVVLGLVGPDRRIVPDAGLGLLVALGAAGLAGNPSIDVGGACEHAGAALSAPPET